MVILVVVSAMTFAQDCNIWSRDSIRRASITKPSGDVISGEQARFINAMSSFTGTSGGASISRTRESVAPTSAEVATGLDELVVVEELFVEIMKAVKAEDTTQAITTVSSPSLTEFAWPCPCLAKLD